MISASAAQFAAAPDVTADGEDRASGARRFFDATLGAWVVKVFPGEYYMTRRADEVLVTVLGSCVSACIRDPRRGIGGMNHFMLAEGDANGWGGAANAARYGNFAMEKLINELLKLGCARSELEIKVFGGGNVTDSRNLIGTENSDFVLRYLEAEGLTCVAQDLRGQYPRRIQYFPSTGRVVRRLLTGSETSAIARNETEYARRLTVTKPAGTIELFE